MLHTGERGPHCLFAMLYTRLVRTVCERYCTPVSRGQRSPHTYLALLYTRQRGSHCSLAILYTLERGPHGL